MIPLIDPAVPVADPFVPPPPPPYPIMGDVDALKDAIKDAFKDIQGVSIPLPQFDGKKGKKPEQHCLRVEDYFKDLKITENADKKANLRPPYVVKLDNDWKISLSLIIILLQIQQQL